MPRKKKEEVKEESKNVKATSKVSPYGWQSVINKAKFTKPKL